jgi:hypothetical protein
MFTGVIACEFSKIFFRESSRRKRIVTCYVTEDFSHNHLINDELKAGEWRALFPDDPAMIPGADMLRLIVDDYNRDEDVKDYICLRYKTYRGNGQQKIKILSEEETMERKTQRQPGEIQ